MALAVLALAPIPVLAADGDLDPTFGTGGRVTYAGGPANASAIQPDGKIIVAIGGNPYSDFVLVRYNRDGSLDTAFGIGGKVTTDFSGQWAWAYALAVQADGKIVAAGARGGGFALARYNQDGSPDATFGVGGTTPPVCRSFPLSTPWPSVMDGKSTPVMNRPSVDQRGLSNVC